ncbi:hypothetical protein C3B44_08570 [Corynebacterium yudongzhengii]|uniref:MFS transporter n=1 Tax=Corynebacterium yudongzhengii TaxID=2080740 RepID=A0A2U1T490_9CORY|nr:hypothetical protein [Corynebacterium yudongzhengii]AWB82399.1 hypothetical protein C3B44_08570 [Corynebacterium yudongzhengii]PWC00814.1 hypothetical protein DF222_10705 [Corynebacterium yudongzhengii]
MLIYSLIVSSVGVFLLAVAPGPVMLAACWVTATLACQGVQTCVNVLVLNNPRGSAFLSTVQAFRFFGISATPAVLIPVFGYSVAGAFLLPAVVVLVTLGIYGAAKARGTV